MTKRMVFNYHEAAHILGYGSYDAVRKAVERKVIRAESRPGCQRSKVITRAELARVLGLMGMTIDRIDQRSAAFSS